MPTAVAHLAQGASVVSCGAVQRAPGPSSLVYSEYLLGAKPMGVLLDLLDARSPLKESFAMSLLPLSSASGSFQTAGSTLLRSQPKAASFSLQLLISAAFCRDERSIAFTGQAPGAAIHPAISGFPLLVSASRSMKSPTS